MAGYYLFYNNFLLHLTFYFCTVTSCGLQGDIFPENKDHGASMLLTAAVVPKTKSMGYISSCIIQVHFVGGVIGFLLRAHCM